MAEFVVLRVDVDGLPRLQRGFRALNSALLDTPRIFARECIPILRRIIRHAFATEGASTGSLWPDVKEATKRRKRRLLGRVPKILQYEGALLRSLTRRAHPQQVVRVFANEVQFGTEHPAFPFHRDGTSRMPQRDPTHLTAADEREVVEPMGMAYQRAWERAVRN